MKINLIIIEQTFVRTILCAVLIIGCQYASYAQERSILGDNAFSQFRENRVQETSNPHRVYQTTVYTPFSRETPVSVMLSEAHIFKTAMLAQDEQAAYQTCRAYQSTIYPPYTEETPSSMASVGAEHSGPRRLQGETVDPGQPPGNGSPIGGPILPLLFLSAVMVLGIYLRQRKKNTSVDSKQTNNLPID